VYRVEIETVDDLRAVLKETGYSKKAVDEIIKWYNAEHPIN
jgi:predicted Ser/Thr protein kinase